MGVIARRALIGWGDILMIVTFPNRGTSGNVASRESFATKNYKAIDGCLLFNGFFTGYGRELLVCANTIIEARRLSGLVLIGFTILYAGLGNFDIGVNGHANALYRGGGTQIGDDLVFRANDGGQIFKLRGQGDLLLRIQTRRHAINVIIFGRKCRYDYGEGRRFE